MSIEHHQSRHFIVVGPFLDWLLRGRGQQRELSPKEIAAMIPAAKEQGLITNIASCITTGGQITSSIRWEEVFNWDTVFTTAMKIPGLGEIEGADEWLYNFQSKIRLLGDRAQVEHHLFRDVRLVIHEKGPPGLLFPNVDIYAPFLAPHIQGIDMNGMIRNLFSGGRNVGLADLPSHPATVQRNIDRFLQGTTAFLNRHFGMGLRYFIEDHTVLLQRSTNVRVRLEQTPPIKPYC